MADALESLGMCPIDAAAGRDAIHIAVLPAIAGEDLQAGQDVGVYEGVARKTGSSVGIVDPFLKDTVLEGERFWILVYPRTITGLRHVWSHPSLPTETPVFSSTAEQSEAWLKAFIERSDCPKYETVLKMATQDRCYDDETNIGFNNDGEYVTILGQDAFGYIPPEFWDHLSVVTGANIPSHKRARYFSCSC